MASSLSHPSLSPIDNLPYDALHEIFMQCVPTYPYPTHPYPTHPYNFNRRFKMTPLILSHVCSFWRVVAHTSPQLWSYLSQTIAMNYRHGRLVVLKRHINLIRFWRSKHGTLFPFIHMDVRGRYPFEEEHLFDADEVSFILEYLASAKYLYVDATIWNILAARKIPCPNLSIVVLNSNGRSEEQEDIVSNLQSVMGLTATPPLQRLSILGFQFYPENALLSPGTWSLLTHIALRDIEISLHFWFDFVGMVPALRWAYLSIYRIEVDHENLIEYTLPQLCSLFIESQDDHICDLLSNLYFPTLHTLSVSMRRASHTLRGNRENVIAKLSNALKRAPSITTLGLSETFLPDFEDDSEDSAMGLPSTLEPSLDTTPFWTHTPHLTHFLFEKFYRTEPEDIAERAGLYRSDCPIQKLTVVNKQIWDVTVYITVSKDLVFNEHGSGLGRNIRVEFGTETLNEKAWTASKTWQLVD